MNKMRQVLLAVVLATLCSSGFCTRGSERLDKIRIEPQDLNDILDGPYFEGKDERINEIEVKRQDLKSNGPFFEDKEFAIDERAEIKHRSGIIRILESMTTMMQTILSYVDGHAKMADIVTSVQEFVKAMESFINIKAIINEVPFVGPTVSWIITPILSLISSLVKETPVFGELLSQMLIGPVYPVTLPPTTAPPPTKSGWIFG
ncbi:uncharacterized protein LOC126889345 isoform X1 [Diabrotica virgifera virgifera]|uniref:Uncharacterized protein n=2 Tax=Diabrotica virgifera virgifera TaxID=50390 RepID=A0ABM5KTM2_DIAVI|nr:uncharacterized protein LOC126889345 isoform X1 [Diabrotica virgifera virgifera]